MTPHASRSAPEVQPVIWRQVHAPPQLPAPPSAVGTKVRYERCLRLSWRLSGRSRHTPARARAYVSSTCRAWDVPSETIDALTLITSELATNAVVHALGDEVVVSLLLSPTHAWVVVADQGCPRAAIAAREAPDSAEGGRGLLLVETLATRFQVEGDDGDGTRVWACVQLPAPRTASTGRPALNGHTPRRHARG
ncbi:ATP-binding protein [Streptomyces sp. NPDC007984]|uniref:ATP-binding protein n=1 Tax=Streptomyces sp. NPDC007984 TaxID=3364801 RepID=UPI0036E0CC94